MLDSVTFSASAIRCTETVVRIFATRTTPRKMTMRQPLTNFRLVGRPPSRTEIIHDRRSRPTRSQLTAKIALTKGRFMRLDIPFEEPDT